jgi:hypothetical protein
MNDDESSEDARHEEASCELRVSLDHRFDIAALRRLRRTLADAGNVSHLQLDFASVRWLDAAALHLLADDLAGIEARGTSVVVQRLDGVAGRLLRHPLRRFAVRGDVGARRIGDARLTDDELFTDPDRDLPGFVPSGR